MFWESILRFRYVDLCESGYAFMSSVYAVNRFLFMAIRTTHRWAGPCID